MAKYYGWQNVPTIQFKEIISELIDAKEEQKSLMLIASTGIGKTNAINAFASKQKRCCYTVTLGDSFSLKHLLNDLLSQMGQEEIMYTCKRYIGIRRITQFLKEKYEEGETPIIILDEAENCRIPALKAIKEIYDLVHKYCSIVLIGTEQLIHQINKKAMGQSIPQLRRRFKAGTRFITPFNKSKDMKPFFNALIPNEEDLKDMLISLCDNYGELHDYLDPFLRYCDKRNLTPNEKNFRLYHKIPSQLK
ncbi:MAG: ATP-binding protein [Chitinophagaceae bacterium]|nr:ATP-binding protein [Chitinophagaceae bacterium]